MVSVVRFALTNPRF